ncbi:MAG: DUF4215 domain-containing protein [bacterium]|nr:DUF4215 domain-containing protein [bacterium]
MKKIFNFVVLVFALVFCASLVVAPSLCEENEEYSDYLFESKPSSAFVDRSAEDVSDNLCVGEFVGVNTGDGYEHYIYLNWDKSEFTVPDYVGISEMNLKLYHKESTSTILVQLKNQYGDWVTVCDPDESRSATWDTCNLMPYADIIYSVPVIELRVVSWKTGNCHEYLGCAKLEVLFYNCEGPSCGDGILESPEECDDGNNANGDGCSSSCDVEDVDCSDADYVYDVDMIVVGDNCLSGWDHPQDQVLLHVPEGGSYEVKGEVWRGHPGQCQTNEDFFLEINGGYGPETDDDALACAGTVRLDDLGVFDFTSGTNDVFMNTAAQCPPDTHPNSVKLMKICLYSQYTAECGNGIVDAGEDCDDGNSVDDDSCTNDCTFYIPPLPYCGNGIVEAGEDCDDGNSVDDDSCTNDCTFYIPPLPYCGDGNVDPGEECDDGNSVNYDSCTNDCTIFPPLPVCGNGVVEPGEECDDGNDVNDDSCTNDCTIFPPVSYCGNGIVESGEDCDDGNDVNDDSCTNDCTWYFPPLPVCGNGVVEPGEECDDGNQVNFDTCSTECTIVCAPIEEICNNGIDDDCDGFVDFDDSDCVCTPGDEQEAPCGVSYVGECQIGTKNRICISTDAWGSWSECIGAIYPIEEICFNGLDDDCDGQIDEGCVVPTPVDPEEEPDFSLVQFRVLPFFDVVNPGDAGMYILVVENIGSQDLERLRMATTVFDFDFRTVEGPFDLDEGETVTKVVYVDVPDYSEAGHYDVRFTVTGDMMRRTKHRLITVK